MRFASGSIAWGSQHLILMTLPKKAINLILESEGIDQPSRWPGGGSGITLGYGVDIGADPGSLAYWLGILSEDQIRRLSTAQGLTGRAAATIASRFADIRVTKDQALKVFEASTLPREISLTQRAFPDSDKLPPLAFGALVSLVYNRGAGIDDTDRRKEMKAIRDAIKNSTPAHGESDQARVNNLLRFIASQFRSMKRLWQGQGLDGLITRRENEARLVESAIS